MVISSDQSTKFSAPGTKQHTRRSKSSGRVLVIGDDAQSFLAVVRSLGRKGIEVHAAPFDWHAPALKSRYVAKTHHLPRIQPGTKAWVDAICALNDTHDFDLIIPCSERSLLPLWQHRDAFAPNQLAYPGDEAMARLFDKLETRTLAQKCHVPVAKGRALSATDTGASLIAELGAPLFIKSRQSYTLDNLSDRGSVAAVKNAEAADKVLAGIPDRDRFLVESGFPVTGPGIGMGISVLAQQGKILVAFQHRRLREKPGGGASSIRISEALDPEMLQACTKMAAATRLNGVAMFEFRKDDTTGDWVLLEVNARFWGSVALAIAAGIDFPAKLYDMMVTGKVEVPTGYRHGALSSNSLQAMLHLLGDPKISAASKPFLLLGEFARRVWRWARRKEDVDELAADDLMPGIAAHMGAPKRLFDRLRWQSDGEIERRAPDLAAVSGDERMFADFAQLTPDAGRTGRTKAGILARLWGNDSIKTFGVRIAGVGVGFCLNIILARALGAAEFGTYAAVWTWVVVLGGLAPLGFSMAATRFLAGYFESGSFGHARGFLRLAMVFVGTVALVLALSMAAMASLIAPPAYLLVALIGALCLPFFAFTELGKGIARGAGWQLLAYAPAFVMRPAVLLVIVAIVWALAVPLDAAGALGLTLAATAMVAVTQWGLIHKHIGVHTSDARPQWDVRNWISTALPLSLVEGYTLFLSFADIIILQFFVPMAEVGLYYVAAKVAATVAFVHIAVSSAAAKPIAAAFARHDRAAIKQLSRRFIAQSFYPTLLIALALAVFGGVALSLFGQEFAAAKPILLVLISGLVVQAATGPLKFTLSMTGEHNAVARIVAVSMLLNVALNIVLILSFGAIGAAMATALVTAASCLLMMLLVKKRLGFWSIIGA